MGVVWKAVDTTLDREVAIKVLPEGVRRRTASGWRVSSARPSCWPRSTIPTSPTVHGLHESEGVQRFLAMELVAGRGPGSSVWSRGPLSARTRRSSLPDAGRLRTGGGARERCRPPRPQAGQHPADAGRHGQGAGLRTGQGLRTGLDRLDGPIRRSRRRSPPAGNTAAGVILGTAAYMSPEQGQGQAGEIGAPTSGPFGVVLHEMLTGRLAVSRGERAGDAGRRADVRAGPGRATRQHAAERCGA